MGGTTAKVLGDEEKARVLIRLAIRKVFNIVRSNLVFPEFTFNSRNEKFRSRLYNAIANSHVKVRGFFRRSVSEHGYAALLLRRLKQRGLWSLEARCTLHDLQHCTSLLCRPT